MNTGGSPATVLAAGRYPDSKVLFDDVFTGGPAFHRWEPLISNNIPRGVVGWDQGGLVLCTEDQPDGAEASFPQGQATAIKRITRFEGATKYAFEVWWSWWAMYGGAEKFKAVEFAIDTCKPEGARHYYSYRWLNYNENTHERESHWYLRAGTEEIPTYTLLPDGGEGAGQTPFPSLPYNEGKRNMVYTRMVVDLNAEVYEGLKVNNSGWGSLNPQPNTEHRAFTGSTSNLPTFDNGLNFIVNLRNLLEGSKSSSAVFTHRARATVAI